ncbi:MAG: class II aldolase/adducin family protein [Halioglobus sp.]|nr:class II aldolase/adducin family protein [Halioglobus sp.]
MTDEGYIKFDLEWVRSAAPDALETAALREWRRPLFDRGLIGHCRDLNLGYGNISVRSQGIGHFIISGTQTGHLRDPGERSYTRVTAYDIAANRVRCEGAIRASSESMTHAALYELSPNINAVVHVHSATLWQKLIDILPTTAPSAAYGTPAMAGEFRRLYRDTAFAQDGIAIMAAHNEGIVSTGHNMAEASRRILALCDKILVPAR